MSFTIDIDTGGTFTDCFLHGSHGEVRTVKVPTTPHDLTVCFLDSIRAGAEAWGLPVGDLLSQTEIVRFSSTIGTNTIIQRDGARVGLLVTRGHEALAPTVDAAGRRPLVLPSMVIGLDEAVNAAGQVTRAPDAASVLEAAQSLIDLGARCLVVALDHSNQEPANERRVREVIKNEYPRDYLGSVPVFLSSDLTTRQGYGLRINTAVLNAYIHGRHARLLYHAGEQLRRLGYRGTLFIGHNTGTVARVAKTRAINTYNSGPAAGLLGAREIGRIYGESHVIATDMGGTSYDIGWVSDGLPGFTTMPDVEGFRCNLPMMSIRALGAGGGSIAQVEQGKLRVGPESAGAMPGPACFGLGGLAPTVTDANVVAGILDPDYFLGGGMKLVAAKAAAAIEQHIARPLGLTVPVAAARIRSQIEREVGAEVARVRASMPAAADPVMIAYGGAGALHACGIAGHAGIRRIVITPFAAVASAFGSSLLDVGHLYDRRIATPLGEPKVVERLAAAIGAMRKDAARDMRGEGFKAEDVRLELQLYVQEPDGGEVILTASDLSDAAAAIAAARKLARAQFGEAAAPGLMLGSAGLLASAAVPHCALTPVAIAAGSAAGAIRQNRRVLLGDEATPCEVPVYSRERLGNGHALEGPAIVESGQTTLLVPPGWHLEIDRFNHIVLNSVADEGG